MQAARRRLLSTAATNGNGRSKAHFSRALIAAAAAAPVGFGWYKYEYDPEFQNTVNRALKFDFGGGAAAKKSPAEEPLPKPAAEVSVKSVEPEPDTFRISVAELDELERILVPEVTSVTYGKEAVEKVNSMIAEVDNATQEKSKEEKPSEAPAEENKPESAAQPETPAAPVEQPAPEPTPTREAVESLRVTAKRVEQHAIESARADLEKADSVLRQDIEKVLAKDLSALSLEGLRERVVQLTLELKDRNRWEAIRLHEVISKTVEDVSRKYLALMKEQESAYENLVRAEVANAASAATVATEERLSKSLQERLLRQKQALAMEMELAISQAREEERHVADKERKARLTVIHDLEKKLVELDELLKERDRLKAESTRTKHALQAALRFTRSVFIEKDSPVHIEEALSELRVATAGDSVIAETLDALPHRIFASGIPTLHKLCKKFEKDVKPNLIQASLIPEDATLLQTALAKATSALLVTNKPSVSPLPDDDSIDARITRVQVYLDKEDLVSAVSELQSFPEKVLKACNAQDWLAQAQDRLKVEAAIKLLTARLESKQ